jgi:hypothetical protein
MGSSFEARLAGYRPKNNPTAVEIPSDKITAPIGTWDGTGVSSLTSVERR